MIRNINKTYFFVFELLKEGSFYLPYSDIEKTFIDLVVFNQSIDKQLLKEIKKKINFKKLETYLKRYPEKIRTRVKKLI